MIAIHFNGRYFSVVAPGGIIAHDATREAAAAAIIAAVEGIDPAEVERLLDNPCDPATFRTVFAAATANSLLAIESEIQALPDSEALQSISRRQDSLSATLRTLQQELEAERRHTRMKELELYLADEADRIRGVLISKKQHTGFSEALIARELAKTKAARELEELRAA